MKSFLGVFVREVANENYWVRPHLSSWIRAAKGLTEARVERQAHLVSLGRDQSIRLTLCEPQDSNDRF